MREIIIDNFIKQALLEDMPYGDITTDSLIEYSHQSKAYFLAKEDGIIAGLDVAKRVFHFIDSNLDILTHVKDGELIKKGDLLATIEGRTQAILCGERLALNVLQRMSGVATLTRHFVEKVKPHPVKIVDTRKTTPNFRFFEKEAVRLGGGMNHRFNLSDAVMIKDNHIVAAGGITSAVNKIREKIPHTTKIEVEVETMDMFKEALEVGCDIIMLDNMSLETMEACVALNKGRALLEASRNMSLDRVCEVAKVGVDLISVGALTHSYKALDISLRFNS